MRLIEWSLLSEAEQHEVRSLEISDQQLNFTGPTKSAVELAEDSDGQDLVGLAIIVDPVVVGLLLLKRRSKALLWVPVNAAAVSAFRIDLRHQSQGFGTRALDLVPGWVKQNWPESQSLVLAVDEPNTAAIRSYIKAGWTDDGITVRGSVGWERRMTFRWPSNTGQAAIS